MTGKDILKEKHDKEEDIPIGYLKHPKRFCRNCFVSRLSPTDIWLLITFTVLLLVLIVMYTKPWGDPTLSPIQTQAN